jgi:hypothetical protein
MAGLQEWVATGIVMVVITAVLPSTRLPRVKRGAVGVGVAIRFEDGEEGKQVREDFITTLRDLVAASASSHKFAFVELPQSVAARLDKIEEVDRIARQCNLLSFCGDERGSAPSLVDEAT